MEQYDRVRIRAGLALAWTYWLNLARHPLFSTLANTLGVFAGLIGALYTDDLRAAFPFQWHNWSGLSLHALLFWLFFWSLRSRSYRESGRRTGSASNRRQGVAS